MTRREELQFKLRKSAVDALRTAIVCINQSGDSELLEDLRVIKGELEARIRIASGTD